MAKEMNFEALQANLALLDKKAKMANEQIKAEGNYDSKMEKLNELLSDEAFCDKLLQADDVQQAKALFAENGVEISEDKIDEFGKYIASVSKKLIENGGELSEEELEEAAGGAFPLIAGAAGYSFIGGASMISTGSIGSAASAGAAAGTAGCPVVGTIIGAVVAAAVVTGIIYRKEVASGVKKLGKWIKSWF